MPSRGTLYGYAIESELPVARLRTGPAPRGEIVLARATTPLLDEHAELVEVVEDVPGGAIIFAVARSRAALLAWSAPTGGHRLEASRGRILSERSESLRCWQDLVVSNLVPLLLMERGELLLHAAAVRVDHGAVLVCGPSGRGKSTIAAALDGVGLPLLAEDVVAVTVANDVVLAWPGPLDARIDARANARLTPDRAPQTTIRGKRLREGGHGHGADPVPVVAIAALEPRRPAPLEVHPLAPVEALAWVFPSVLRLERDSWPAAYARAAEIVRRVPCHRARLQDDLAAAPREASELVERITRLGTPQLTAA